MHCYCKCYIASILLIFGTIFLIIGVFALLFLPNLIDQAIKDQYHLGQDKNGADNIVLKMYRDPPYDVKMKIWIISVQNPSGVIEHGEKANVTEIGPYIYDIHLHKKNVTFARNGTRMFYRNVKSFVYNADKSCSGCKLEDKVTVPNIVFQKIVDVLEQNPGWQLFVEPLIKGNENVFVTVSADELLFKGYKDKLLAGICENPLTKALCEKYNVPERVGLFYGKDENYRISYINSVLLGSDFLITLTKRVRSPIRPGTLILFEGALIFRSIQNNTDDGIYEIDTGLGDVERIGRVYSWNGMEGMLDSAQYWYGDGARLIRGTDGQLFRPNLYNETKLEISFDLEFQKSTIFSDIPVRRFIQPVSLLDADHQRAKGFCNPRSADYFHNETIQQASCAPSGLLDLSTCLPGHPRLFLSQSHFLGTSDPFRDSLVGLPPANPDRDTNFYDIEPLTGTAVHVHQGIQMNVGILKGKLRMTRRMREHILPIIRMEQLAVVDPGTKKQLQLPLTILHVSHWLGIILIPLGSLLLLISLALITFWCTKSCRKKSSKDGPNHLTTMRPLNNNSIANNSNNHDLTQENS